MVVSTHFETKMARRAKLYSVTTGYGSTGVGYFTTGFGAEGTVVPGFIYATAHTYINFPVEKPGEDMLFYILYNGPSTSSTTYCYAAVSIQKRNSSGGGFIDSTVDSTRESAFDRIYSTAFFDATSTECEGFLLGPIDTYKYGCTYGATSSGDVDQHQTFIRMMVGYSTAVGYPGSTGVGCTHDALSTNAPANGYMIMAFQLGSTMTGEIA